MTEWHRIVSHRCPNMGRHGGPYSQGCPCHPMIPTPCPECFCVESLSRRVPYQAYSNTTVEGTFIPQEEDKRGPRQKELAEYDDTFQ